MSDGGLDRSAGMVREQTSNKGVKMKRAILVVGAAVAGLAAALATMGSADAGSTTVATLRGTVGPGFTITLAKAGKNVKTLKPGSYTITVKDKSASHNFHIFGPGVAKVVTSVPFVGTKKVTVMLKKGTYTIQCDPHAQSGMKSTFKVS
jgi:plastocyanin